jgi:FAD/FMN-containing dehydrogenase
MSHRHSPLQREKQKSVSLLRSAESEAHSSYQISIPRPVLAAFAESIYGVVVFPWSKSYEKDRQEFDDLYPTYPQLIVYVVSTEDIAKSLAFAKEYSLQVAVRSGGHSLAGFSVCDGMVIDMSRMKSVYVEPSGATVLIESGAAFQDIFPAVEPRKLHMVTGDCDGVCPAGFMMGGGYGMTTRMFGMGCDNVVEVTVMLADGKTVVANAKQNQDLFWAIRGGTGGNFGVLISMRWALHHVGTMHGVQVRWPIDEKPALAAKVLHTIQEQYLKPGVLPQLGIETIMSSNEHAKKTLFFCASWIGELKDFDAAIKPVLDIGGHTINRYSGRYSHVNNKVLEGTPDIPEDVKGFSRGTYLQRHLSEAEWYQIAEFFHKNAPNRYTMIDMEAYGGYVSTLPETYNAFIHRDVTVNFYTEAFFDKKTNDREQNEVWCTKLMEFMKPYAIPRSYANYPFRGQKDFRTAYWGRYYNQLVKIKSKYDPANFFNYMQSIGPDFSADKDQIILFPETPIIHEQA